MILANATLSELKTIRSNIDEYFHEIYTKASVLAQELCFSISLPRIARKQKNRDNYSVVHLKNILKYQYLYLI